MEPQPEYLTTEEVAKLFRRPVETLRYWRNVGRGPASFKMGRRVLYARADVEAYVAEARGEQAGGASGGASANRVVETLRSATG